MTIVYPEISLTSTEGLIENNNCDHSPLTLMKRIFINRTWHSQGTIATTTTGGIT